MGFISHLVKNYSKVIKKLKGNLKGFLNMPIFVVSNYPRNEYP